MPMPTLQQIIGTITGKVAFERTQANFIIIKDAHDDLDDVVIAHKAEITSQAGSFTRDLTIMGAQKIITTKKPKSIFAISAVGASGKSSIGLSSGITDYAIYGISNTTSAFSTRPDLIAIFDEATSRTFGNVTLIEDDGFTITWSKSTNSAIGTITVQWLVLYHG